MYQIIPRRHIFFAISGALVAISVASLLAFGLKLGIDFTSGSILRLEFEARVTAVELKAALEAQGIEGASLKTAGENTFLIRSATLLTENKASVESNLREALGSFEELSFNSVGPVIGRELTRKAFLAVAVASLGILIYLTWSFRKVDRPVRYGITAVFTLVHDSMILLGAFSILGRFAGVEVDSLFVTALLTVVGFSVHDTIVVFDRIRENRSRHRDKPFSDVVNFSLNQTIDRSLNTSLTAIFVLAALFVLGGTTIRDFVLALLIGISVGTYSSIFTASCLLAGWEEGDFGKLARLPFKALRA
jgi:preprotein translocase subunit SecF